MGRGLFLSIDQPKIALIAFHSDDWTSKYWIPPAAAEPIYIWGKINKNADELDATSSRLVASEIQQAFVIVNVQYN